MAGIISYNRNRSDKIRPVQKGNCKVDSRELYEWGWLGMNHEERVVKPQNWRPGAPLLVPRNSAPATRKADFAVLLAGCQEMLASEVPWKNVCGYNVATGNLRRRGLFRPDYREEPEDHDDGRH